MKTKKLIFSKKLLCNILILCSKKTFVLAFSLFCANTAFSQKNFTESLTNKEVSNKSLLPFFSNIDKGALTSSPTLNSFFATKISTYLSEASDLSLSSAYAVLDKSDDRLFLGGTFNKKQSTDEYKRFLFTAGVKANIKSDFSNIFDSEGINNDIGISFKTTLFGRGNIWFYEDSAIQKDKVDNKRKEIVNELLVDFDMELSKFKKIQIGLRDSATSVKNFIEEYEKKMASEFPKKEAEYIIKKTLFNQAHTWWVSGDIYIPATKSIYKTINDFSSTSFTSSSYRPYELNLVYTNFWEKNKWTRNIFLMKGITMLTFKGTLIANNSVKASMIKSYSLDQYLMQSSVSDTLFLAKLKSETVYVGEFKEFITPKISARYVYMPLSFIGASFAIEKSFGKVDDLTWSIGIPVSLKNSEGKSKVNFELVWREISNSHSIGLSIGLPITGTIF